ncbi:hypothetical protein FBU30_008587 [Linnemannia zychae]|nr:hypothetical protein FBU30_008587 [Linnemannia zychae]
MGVASELEPRTSMERHLMERDREGQLFLEARRQQAALDLLKNRTSLLSTITPPSSNPSSVASSLYHEPTATSATDVAASTSSASTSQRQHTSTTGVNIPLPNTPTSPFAGMSPAASQSSQAKRQDFAMPPGISSTSPYPYSLPAATPAIQTTTSVFSLKKTRQRSATGPGRGRGDTKEFVDRPVLPISPSSLEYQLTASLLNYHPPSTSTAQSQPNSRSRSKSRLQPLQGQPPQQHPQKTKTRRHTVNKDTRIDTTPFHVPKGTGHRQQYHRHHHKHNDSNGSNGSNTTSSSSKNQANRNGNGNAVQPMTPQEWTPVSLLGSFPPSPAACALGPDTSAFDYFVADPSTTPTSEFPPALKQVSLPLPPLPPSPPLPPLPPKSPRALIAQYFPRSLPPPPSRDRAPFGRREPAVAPTPFKTPTFGPALASPTLTTHSDAPPLPSPSVSFQYIPSADVSRPSTSNGLHNPHNHHPLNEDNSSEFSSSSNCPSPNASVVGLQGSATATPRMTPQNHPPSRLPSDLDLILNNSRQRSGRQPCPSSISNQTNQSSGSASHQDETSNRSSALVMTPAAPILLFAPLRPRSPGPGHGIRATHSTTSLSTSPFPPNPTALPTKPIYPRQLSSPSILDDSTQVVLRLHQKPVPYIRELFPGKETDLAVVSNEKPIVATTSTAGTGPSPTVAFMATPSSEPSSTNTSRDLEMVVDEITGRIRTNRTSMDPWAFNISPWDDKPLPPVRRERGSRYWVFRDQDGLVFGPILFLLGHLFFPLWWVGAVYPRLTHPDDVVATANDTTRAAEMEVYSSQVAALSSARDQEHARAQNPEVETEGTKDRQNGVALQWLQRQLKTLGVTVASITFSSKTQAGSKTNTDGGDSTITTFRMSHGPHASSHDDRENSTLANISTVNVPYIPSTRIHHPPSILESHGPWAARGDSSRASSLFERRMARDRKILRYELDLRWRRINMLWSFVSFLIAVCVVAIVYGVRN